jgi:hypothetical protein
MTLCVVKFASQQTKAGATIRFGVATVPLPLGQWLARDSTGSVHTALHAFTLEHQLQLCGVMATGTDPKTNAFTRQLVLYAPPTQQALLQSLTGYLESKTNLKLVSFDTKPYDSKAADAATASSTAAAPASVPAAAAAVGPIVFYSQQNIEASRKQVLPFLISALAD